MTAPVPEPPHDAAPGIWIGHVSIDTDDLPATIAYYISLGMRTVHVDEGVGILELAGGTHLVILPRNEGAEPSTEPVDLMLDDLDAAHAAWTAHEPSEIVSGSVHREFTMRDPGGNRVIVRDSHVIAKV